MARVIRSRTNRKLCACGCGKFTALSDRTWAKYGMVKGQPLRFIKGHNRTIVGPPMPPKGPPGQGTLRHGLSRKDSSAYPFWCAWSQMRQRCLNPNQTSFQYYGARGISVCERWSIFENFYEDMFPTWRIGLSLERKDGDKGYSPDNCVWATRKEQVRNRSNTRMVEVGDERMPVADAVEKFGVVDYDCVANRLRKGWSLQEALTTPKRLQYQR